MSPATIHLRAKREETWTVLEPFVRWLMRNSKIDSISETNCGLFVKCEASQAEFIHLCIAHHRLPLTVEVTVEALQ